MVAGSLRSLSCRIRLELVDLALIAYWMMVLFIHLLGAGRLSSGPWSWAHYVVLDLAMIGLVLAVAWASRRLGDGARVLVRLITVSALFTFGYWYIGRYILLVRPRSFEPELVALDQALFGGTLGEVLEPYSRVWLTDLLQMCYASYYFLPLVLFIVSMVSGRYYDAKIVMLGLVLAFTTDYLLYVLVPARSPYIVALDPSMGHLVSFSGDLNGSGITTWIRGVLHGAQGNYYDCFPSGHTQMSLTMLVLSFRFQKRLFPLYLFLVSGMIFGTLYRSSSRRFPEDLCLRHHAARRLAYLLPSVPVWVRTSGTINC